MGDTVKGKADSAASTAQPQSDKSVTQRVGDAVSGNQNETQVRARVSLVAFRYEG